MGQIFVVLGVLSMLVGGFSMVGQTDIKRLLAYSSISQMGYIFVGLGIATPLSILAAIFHIFNHSIFKSLLFLNAGAIEYATGTRDLGKLGGLSQRMPTTSMTQLVGALSISGIPPFNGFWSKLLIILAAVAAGHFWAALAAVVASLLTLAALLKAVKGSLWGAVNEITAAASEVPALMRYSMTALAVICLCGGLLLLPTAQRNFLNPAVTVVLQGQHYADTVFQGLK
jgi:multicomponent Na+:H+ antiporter subunit D